MPKKNFKSSKVENKNCHIHKLTKNMTLIFKFDMHLPWIKGWNSGQLIILHPNLNEIYHLDSLQKTVYTNYNLYVSLNEKQIIVLNKKCHLTIQITNDRPVHVLPLVNYNVQWPFIGYLYCMTSLFIRHYKLLQQKCTNE